MAYIPCKIGGGRQPIEIPTLQFSPTQSSAGAGDYNVLELKLNKKYKKLTIDSCTWNRIYAEYTWIYSVENGVETQLDRLASTFSTQYELDITGVDVLKISFWGKANAYNYEPPKVTYNNVVIS